MCVAWRTYDNDIDVLFHSSLDILANLIGQKVAAQLVPEHIHLDEVHQEASVREEDLELGA